MPVLRHMRNARRPVFGDALFAEVLPLIDHGTALCLPVPGQDLHSLLLAVALNAGDAQHLPLAQGKAQVIHLPGAEFVRIIQMLHAQDTLAELLFRLVIFELYVAAHHQPGDLLRRHIRHLAGLDGTAVL